MQAMPVMQAMEAVSLASAFLYCMQRSLLFALMRLAKKLAPRSQLPQTAGGREGVMGWRRGKSSLALRFLPIPFVAQPADCRLGALGSPTESDTSVAQKLFVPSRQSHQNMLFFFPLLFFFTKSD